MEANTLRIGNYLQDQFGNLLKVVELTEHSIVTSVIDRSKFPLPDGWKAQPIPLSEDWLFKVGFKHYKDDAFILKIDDNRTIQINNLDSNPHLWLKDEFSTAEKEYVFICHPQYLHQLQNVFQILKNAELTIKE